MSHADIRETQTHPGRIHVFCPMRDCVNLVLYGPMAPFVSVAIVMTHRLRHQEGPPPCPNPATLLAVRQPPAPATLAGTATRTT